MQINSAACSNGQEAQPGDTVTLQGKILQLPQQRTILLHKPVGYVVSRNGQGSTTIYNLLPPALAHLKPVGRLDKDSSGLLLLTTDGQLAQQLTHPKFQKRKVYMVRLNKLLADLDTAKLHSGVLLEDGISHLEVRPATTARTYRVRMYEGRNRQIRRTFAALGYQVQRLHRTQFGDYSLGTLASGAYREVA